MFDALGEEYWSWFAVTASDQVHIDACSEELAVMLNGANAMAPIFAAVCGNSPITGGRRSPHGAIAGRDAAMVGLQRYGLPERLGFEHQRHWPVTSMEDWVQSVSDLSYLLRPAQTMQTSGKSKSTELSPPPGSPPNRSFRDFVTKTNPHLVATEDDLWEEFKSHERYVWHAARPRWQQGTVEFRGACQQPHVQGEVGHMIPSALALGAAERASQIWDLLSSDPRVGGWAGLGMWYHAAIVNGLGGTGYGPCEKTAGATVIEQVLHLVEDGLRDRGLGEEVYLQPVWERLQTRQNPGQVLRHLYEDTERPHRAAALLEHTQVTV